MSVCVCLSVREHISVTVRPIFTKFVMQIPVTMVQSSGGIAIRNVLLVLWMTSHLAIVGCMAMRYDTGVESDVYECLVSYGDL